jgi:peptide/nickel transport system substrate-binding protein
VRHSTLRRLWAVPLLLMIACGPATTSRGPEAPAVSQAPSGPKRLQLAIISEPTGFHIAVETQRLGITSAGLAYHLFPGLTVWDHEEVLRATTGEAVPSVENGLWKVFPDGRMETTHPIRANAKWHDGTPVTGEDLRFTVGILGDPELAQFRMVGVDLIEKVEAGPRSATITWKQPFIEADAIFGTGQSGASRSGVLPRHLLEEEYQRNKAGFTELRYWSEEFVGLGPYRLKEWARGSHLLLAAFDGYALGRPKIDELQVRFIPDPNTMIANMLSGTLDMPHGSIVGMDQADTVRDQWRNGKMHIVPAGWVVAYAQSIEPQPRVVSNVQFRRALLHAIDRQQLVDTLMQGLLPVAQSVFTPGTPEYAATESSIVRYDYDPRKARAMIEELGYTRGGDGMFRDAGGQTLNLEVRSYAQRDIHHKTLFPVVDYWKQLGVAAEPIALSADRARDAREQATFPSFLVLRQPNGQDRMLGMHSRQARTPERNFQGTNNGRYLNPELDGLIEQFQSTIPMNERMQVAGKIVHHLSDQLPILTLFYDALPVFINSKVYNAHPHDNLAWNVHEWELR